MMVDGLSAERVLVVNEFLAAIEDGEIDKVRAAVDGDVSLVGVTEGRLESRRPPPGLRFAEGPPMKNRSPGRLSGLHVASLRGRVEIARLLIERGADVNAHDTSGHTPIHSVFLDWMPVREPVKLELIRLLIESGADVNARGSMDRTPIYEAVSSKRATAEVLEYMISVGADVNAVDEYGWTPLDSAMFRSATRDMTAVFELLIRHAAEVNAPPPTKGQYGPLLWRSADLGNSDITRPLIDAGAKLEAHREGRGTALHAAARRGHDRDVELLLEARADPGAVDEQGRTPLDLVASHLDAIAILARHLSTAKVKS